MDARMHLLTKAFILFNCGNHILDHNPSPNY